MTVIWPLASVFAWWHRRSGRRCSSRDGDGLGRGGRCAVRGAAGERDWLITAGLRLSADRETVIGVAPANDLQRWAVGR